MASLQHQEQEELLVQYQRDYGEIVLNYNAILKGENLSYSDTILDKSILLQKRILRDLSPTKNRLSQKRKQFALEIVDCARKFIGNGMTDKAHRISSITPKKKRTLKPMQQIEAIYYGTQSFRRD